MDVVPLGCVVVVLTSSSRSVDGMLVLLDIRTTTALPSARSDKVVKPECFTTDVVMSFGELVVFTVDGVVLLLSAARLTEPVVEGAMPSGCAPAVPWKCHPS
jgi:hypothetical protein